MNLLRNLILFYRFLYHMLSIIIHYYKLNKNNDKVCKQCLFHHPKTYSNSRDKFHFIQQNYSANYFNLLNYHTMYINLVHFLLYRLNKYNDIVCKLFHFNQKQMRHKILIYKDIYDLILSILYQCYQDKLNKLQHFGR